MAAPFSRSTIQVGDGLQKRKRVTINFDVIKRKWWQEYSLTKSFIEELSIKGLSIFPIYFPFRQSLWFKCRLRWTLYHNGWWKSIAIDDNWSSNEQTSLKNRTGFIQKHLRNLKKCRHSQWGCWFTDSLVDASWSRRNGDHLRSITGHQLKNSETIWISLTILNRLSLSSLNTSEGMNSER